MGSERAHVWARVADRGLHGGEIALERLETEEHVDWLRDARVATKEERLCVEMLHIWKVCPALDVSDELAKDGGKRGSGQAGVRLNAAVRLRA